MEREIGQETERKFEKSLTREEAGDGASVIHGRNFFKKRVRYPDGTEVDELFAGEGEWVHMTYSSVAKMVEFCAACGVNEADWPIYYGVWHGDVDVADVVVRCERLHRALAGLDASERAEIRALSFVREWLDRGEQFAVFE